MSDETLRRPILVDGRGNVRLDPNLSFRFSGRPRRFSSGPPPVGPFGQWLFNDKTQSSELLTSGLF